MVTELNAEQLAFLNAVFAKAAANVSDKIRRWTGQEFTVDFLDVGFIPLAEVPDHTGGGDLYSVATLLPVQSTVQGHLLFIFPELSARVFTDIVLNRTIGETQEWGETEQSVIMETGNILGSSFMNVLATALARPISTSTPLFLIDYAAAIAQQVVLDYALTGDEALLARTRFSKQELDFEEYFVFIPSPDFLAIIDRHLAGRTAGGQ